MSLFGIGNIIGGIASLFGVGSSASQASKDRQFTREENQKNRDFAQSMFDQTNAYNSPKAQMARYLDAGLNPALMYGSTTSGLASATSPSGNSANANPSQLPTALQNFGTWAANIDLIKSQTAKNYADADQASEGAGATRRSNDLYDATRDMQIQRYRLDNQQITTQIEQMRQNIDVVTPAQLSKVSAEINKFISDSQYTDELKRYVGYNANSQRISALASQLSAQCQAYLAPYQASVMVADVGLKGAQADLCRAQITTEYWRAIQLNAEGRLTEAKIEELGEKIANLKNYGSEDPSSGLYSLGAALAIDFKKSLYNMFGLEPTNKYSFTPLDTSSDDYQENGKWNPFALPRMVSKPVPRARNKYREYKGKK